MSDLIKPVPAGLSRCTYAIDSIVCKKIHNPILAATIVAGTLATVVVKQYIAWPPYNLFEESGFLPDFLQNAMNLLFMIRFPPQSRKALHIRSNKYVEGLLFVCLNIVAMVSLCSPYPFSSLMNLAFRVLLWVLIICPYVILALNLAEFTWGSIGEKEQKSEYKREGLLALIVDANNSFMAIFIAQSFTAVNLDLPYYENWIMPVIYKCATYSLKFYLIYCFVLYEIVVVIYDIHDIRSYRELYQPVQLGTRKRTWGSLCDEATPYFLYSATVFALIFDAVMMWLEFSFQHL